MRTTTTRNVRWTARLGFYTAIGLLAACDGTPVASEGKAVSVDDSAAAGQPMARPDILALPECLAFEAQKGCATSTSGCQQPPPHPPGACLPPQSSAPAGVGQEGSMGQPGMRPPPDPLFFLFDVDRSGDLDSTERGVLEKGMVSRCANHKARILARFDTDKDGALSAQELSTARTTVEKELAAKVQKLVTDNDTDGDGCISPQEMQGVMTAQKDKLGKRFDANQDGTLDATELDALRAFLRDLFRKGLMPGEGI